MSNFDDCGPKDGMERMPGMELGIDLGTSQVVIYVSGKGVVLKEPAVIAVDQKDGHMIACGKEARDMLGRSPDSILVIRPLEKGVIAAYDYAEQMLRYLVRKVCAYRILKPRVAVSVPASVTEVEQRSVVEAVSAAGARHVVLIEEAVAAAIGAGLDVSAACGSMVINIGGGTTDMAVLSLKGIATSCSLRIGGNDMDQAIVRYLRNHHNLIIGQRMAEDLKIEIGSALPPDEKMTRLAKGRDAMTGLPAVREVTALEIRDALEEALREILSGVQRVMEATPPELLGDVLENGMMLTGGGAQMRGMAPFLEKNTGVACRVAAQPEECVAVGTGKALKYVHILSAGVYDAQEFSYHLSETLTN